MKIYQLTFVIGMLLSDSICHAVPITSLNVLNEPVEVGDTFLVEVRLDGDQLGEELLSFGFNILPLSSQLSFNRFTINPLLTDVSDPSNPNNVSALAFPGFADNAILLAKLEFSALASGTANIGIEGLLDLNDPFDLFGLFYDISGFDISARTQVTIMDRTAEVPEPKGLALLAVALFILLLRSTRVERFLRMEHSINT